MRLVEVRATRATFADLLGAMRVWLDQNNCGPVRFETEGDGISVTIKIEFQRDDLAERFRHAFPGASGDQP